MKNRNESANHLNELQKYNKNQKQKKLIIGAILFTIFVIGGIELYRTFALYKEEKSFDFINGVIPDFYPICDSNLNGAEPVISGNLIPVVIDENSVVTKVDPTDSDWYDYCGKKWANAVITQNSFKTLEASSKVSGGKFYTDHVNLQGRNYYLDLSIGNHKFNEASLAIRVQVKDLTKTDTKYALISNKTSNSGMSIYLENSTHKIAFSFYNESTGQFEELVSNVIPETNKYYTIVGTYDGHVMNLYVEGELSTKTVEGKIKTSTKNFYIGKNPEESTYSAYLNVKQAGIFDRVISSEEIKKGFTGVIKLYDGASITKFVDFTNRELEAGEVIPEGIIESYFVWVPKFKYKLFDMGNSYTESSKINAQNMKAIHIKFDAQNSKDSVVGECTTPGESKESGNCKVGDWMTHPAFTSFGDVTGLWVGKFETGYNGADSSKTFKADTSNKVDVDKIIIKPNALSWRMINIANAYTNSYMYQRDLDSHMMKNTEWGAVAYLTNSIYGRCTRNDNGTASCEEIAINNYKDTNGSFKTGYAAVNEPTTGSLEASVSCSDPQEACNEFGTDANTTILYQDIASAKASTTGTYSGIYDMNGGGLEYVMAGIEDENHQLTISDSGFTADILPIESKYYDLYKAGTSDNDYTRRILGDATGELGPFEYFEYPHLITNVSSWYKDAGNFITNTEDTEENKTWFNRGGQANDGTAAGLFYFRSYMGRESNARSFRIVLAAN